MRAALESWLQAVWYGKGYGGFLLYPFSLTWAGVASLRRALYVNGIKSRVTMDVPVVVVGNIAAGGTGKTPLTLWLARRLAERGYRPGVVSRGYGGRPGETPVVVDADTSSAVTVGDEPLLYARAGIAPVVVHPDRVAAAEAAVEAGADLVLADDGLQHYRLARDVEIAVIDAGRGLGNRRCLPAGPLREPPSRLGTVDYTVYQGEVETEAVLSFRLVAGDAVGLVTGERKALTEFAGERVHALAGIGNPERFFSTLRGAGIAPVPHPLPDHAAIGLGDLHPGLDSEPVLMTEKDAVKCGALATERHWYVPVELEMAEHHSQRLLDGLVRKINENKGELVGATG